MTYTPDDITAYIAQRVAAVGEDSKDVRILRQLVEENGILRTEKHADAEAIGNLRDELNARGVFSGPMIDSMMAEADNMRARIAELEAALHAPNRHAYKVGVAVGWVSAISTQEKAHD